MADHVNLVKLCVGIDSIEHLMQHRAQSYGVGSRLPTKHITRMFPRRSDELLNGGALYWVIKGVIQARQRIIELREIIGEDGIKRCAILMDPELIRTQAAQRRPFQGWRYLAAENAPPDLPSGRAQETTLPPEMSTALAEIGIL